MRKLFRPGRASFDKQERFNKQMSPELGGGFDPDVPGPGAYGIPLPILKQGAFNKGRAVK